jgi:hypothetical protein
MVRQFERITMNTALPATAALTPKMESFAVAYVEYGDATRSYREVFDCAPDIAPVTVRKRAYDLVHMPKVAARVRELKDAIAERTVVTIAGRLMHQLEIVEADPNDVASVRVYNCRYCATGRYLWIDAAELARAVDAALKSANTPKPLSMPELGGGFGFDPWGDPVATCVHCLGHGIPHPVIHDTTKLSAAGRKLYKGFEIKPDGSIKVLTHDQQAASDMIHKMLGAYVLKTESKSFNVNYNLTAPTSPQAPLSAEDAIAKLRAIGVLAADDDATVVSDQ